MRKLIDCFIFYNELEMLLFRLTELYDTVDFFILVEAKHTFTGVSKILFFEAHKEMFSKYMDKIIHIIVDKMPNTSNPWDNEKYQRNYIHKGILKLNLNCDDVIIISDCDEIPDSNTLNIVKRCGICTIYGLEMDMYYYNLSWKGTKWYHSKIVPYSVYKLVNEPEKIRFEKCKILTRGGWHFSYFGNVEFIRNKIKNFSHQEYNTDKYTNEENIKKSIENGDDLFSRTGKWGHELKHVRLKDNDNLPNNYGLLV